MNIIRAEWDSINWHFRVTTKKDPDWHPVDIPTVELFEELREVLFNKYQRGRMPWSYVESLDKKIADMRDGGE